MKLETKVTLCLTVTNAFAFFAILAQMFKIKKLADSAGVSATNTYVSAIACIVLIVVGGTIIVTTLRAALRKHTQNLRLYSDKIAHGETNFTVKAPVVDEFEAVYNSLNAIVNTNKEYADVATKIAEGDLTVKCSPKSDDDILGNSLVSLIEKNNSVLNGIKESSYQLTTGAEQVAAASQNLAQGSTEQASAIEQISVSMKEIEEMSKNNAGYANDANNIVADTKNAAKLGSERMRDMKNAMNDINDSSEKISKVIKVIDDISFQTNILALNAAVEAARAGAHGKGFAVVAEQIRELAGKSADAAAETADMIDDSIRKVHNGNKLADDTSKALDDIVGGIDKVVNITGEITKASNEQANSIIQIDQAMSQVSQVVQTNSATSEECAAAAEELSSQSSSLRSMISKYKLNNDAVSAFESSPYYSSPASDLKTVSDIKLPAEPVSISSSMPVADKKLEDIKIELPGDDSFDGGFGKY